AADGTGQLADRPCTEQAQRNRVYQATAVLPTPLLVAIFGAALLLIAPWLTRGVVTADRWLARSLLGPGTLTQRVPTGTRCWPRWPGTSRTSPWWTSGCRRRTPTRGCAPRCGSARTTPTPACWCSPSTSRHATRRGCWRATRPGSATC